MKKSILLLVFSVLVLTINSFSQSEEIKGIGVFIIGETKIEDIPGICNNLKIKKAGDISTMKQQSSFVKTGGRPKYARIIFDPIVEMPSFDAPMHPDIQRFLISSYTINDVKLTDFMLTFYKSWLVEIEFKGDLKTVEEIFIAKYGEPTVELIEKPISFVYTYTGNQIEKNDLTIDSRWKQDKIEAQYYNRLSYTPNGLPLIIEYFKIKNTEVAEDVSKKQTQGSIDWQGKKEKDELELKKSKYSDF